MQTFWRIAEGVNLRPGELMRMAEEAMGKDDNWPEAEKRN